MKFASVLSAVFCTLSAVSGLSTASPTPTAVQLESDSLVQAIVNSVSQDSIRATILRLQEFGTRFAATESNYAAVLYAQDRLTSYACDTVYLDYSDTTGYYKPSVIGVKRGRLYPDMEYIICGHIDSDGRTRDSAPGADDNASGTSVVLEACRVFAQHWFNYTVRFACFNCEEGAGPSGAAHYAYEARSRGDSILGVLNFDMVGYGMEGRDSVFVAGSESGPNSADLLQQWCFAANAYTVLKCRPFLCDRDSFMFLDQWWFWITGYQALLVEEVQRTPEMHGPGDTLGPFGYESCGVNNLPLCTEATKAAVAALAVLAQVEGRPGVDEPRQVPSPALRPASAFTRGLPAGAVVFDAMGRRVVNPKLGVYFIRQAQGQTVCKVVITR